MSLKNPFRKKKTIEKLSERDDDQEHECPDCGEMVETGEDCPCTYPEYERLCTDEPSGPTPGGLTEEAKERLTPTTDFTPENPEDLRCSVEYLGQDEHPRMPGGDFPQTLLILTERYATLHCKIRFECGHKGDIAACLSCLSEQILVPDMIKLAGGKIAMWPAKR